MTLHICRFHLTAGHRSLKKDRNKQDHLVRNPFFEHLLHLLETDVELSDGSVTAEVGFVDVAGETREGNVISDIDCSADNLKLVFPVEICTSAVVSSTVVVPCFG